MIYMFCATVQLYSHYATVYKKVLVEEFWNILIKKYVLLVTILKEQSYNHTNFIIFV